MPKTNKKNIVMVMNQKGGVGKTTLSFSVAAAAAKAGRSVLLLDMDPQASLTTWIIGEDEPKWSTFDIFNDTGSKKEILAIEACEGVDLLPSTLDLCIADMVIAGKIRREEILKNFMMKIKGDYDLVLIDCPPTLGIITTNILAAADHIVVPTTAETMSIKGISLLENVIAQLNENGVTTIERIEAIAVMMYQSFITHQRNNASSLRLRYTDAVLPTAIRKGTVASEAAGRGLDIFTYTKEAKKDPRLANDLAAITMEILEKFNL